MNGESFEIINQYGDVYYLPSSYERIACRAIIIDGNKILLSHELNTGVYLTPGGGVEDNETPEECVMREVLEETGYAVSAGRQIFRANEYFFHKLFVNNYFICEIIGKGEQHLTENEIAHGVTPEWVELDKALGIFGNYENITDEELAAQYKREFTVLRKFYNSRG